MRKMRKRAVLAVLAALPITILALRGISIDLIGMFDPCTEWGGGGSGSLYHSTDDPCRQHTINSETKSRAAIRLALAPGLMLLATAIGVWGVLRSRWRLSFIGGCLMMLEAVPLILSVWPLPLLAGAGFLWAGALDLQEMKVTGAS